MSALSAAGEVAAPVRDALAGARAFLTRSRLQGRDDEGTWTPLTGGVSSDLWRVDLPGRTLCVKSALAQLRVRDEWFAPLDRNAVERAWLGFAAEHRRASVPAVYADDAAAGYFAMEFLDPADHPVWKSQLMAGQVDPAFAAAVGDLLGGLAAASTTAPDVAARFATDANFAALRLDPYLRVTARRDPVVGAQLEALAQRTATTRVALVHGDVSPKNILAGPAGPVLLDAECAWFGDPAFDVAFCLTHLLLKVLVVPSARDELLLAARALVEAHAAHVRWEQPAALDARVATLLPAIVLARVDGASPVEYLTDPQRAFVRSTAITMLQAPQGSTLAVLEQWHHAVIAPASPLREKPLMSQSTEHDVPSPVSTPVMREVMGHFASGIVVVTGIDEQGPMGFTCQSFASLSLEPPLIMFSPSRTSVTWARLREAPAFCVNVLAAEHSSYSRAFARTGTDKFAGVTWKPAPSGAPVLDGVSAWIDCTLEREDDGGDHTIVQGRVTHLGAYPERLPLLFYRGAYNITAPLPPAPQA